MNTTRIVNEYNANPLRAHDLDLIPYLTERQRRIIDLIERIAVYGDTSWNVESKLVAEVKAEARFTWTTDAEKFIEDRLAGDLPYWVRRWAQRSEPCPRFDEPRRASLREEVRIGNTRVSLEVSSRETLLIAQAMANLMNAGR